MSRTLVLVLVLLLSGCATTPAGDDGYMSIKWVRVDAADVQRTCEGLSGRKSLYSVLGCSRWSTEHRRCEIYAPEPVSERDTQRLKTLGHELKHCFDGNWHDRWGRMLPVPPSTRRRIE